MKQSNFLNYILVVFLGILAGASLMAIPQTINYFIAFSEEGDNKKMILSGVLIGVEAIIYTITWFLFENKKNSLARTICNRVKQKQVNHLNRYTDVENLRDNFVNKTEVIVENYYKSIFMIFHFISSLLYAVISMMFINWIIGIVLLVMSLLVLLISQFGNKLSIKVENELVEAKKDFNNDFTKNIDGYIYYVFANQRYRVDELVDKTIVQLKNKSISSRILSSLRNSFISILFALLSFIITLTAGIIILKNGSSTGIFVSATILSGFMFGAVSSMTQSYVSINSCRYINKEFKKISSQSYISEVDGDILIKDLKIEFNNKKIFNNFNLEIKKGQKILIKGKSGQGKSTLIKCLAGESITNSVYYGDQIIDKQISSNNVVFMENDYSFVDIDKYNELKVTNYQLLKELEIENIDPLLASKGELQKLKIAYVLSTKAEYQFYDEPFSNIDTKSLSNIIDLMLMQDETVIIVAHNLSIKTMNKFDVKVEL